MPDPAPFHTYRTVLYPGAWTYVWSINGNLDPGAWRLVGNQTYTPTQLDLGLRSLNFYDSAYHHALRIPTDIPNGQYSLRTGGPPGINVTIENAPDANTPNLVVPDGTDDQSMA